MKFGYSLLKTNIKVKKIKERKKERKKERRKKHMLPTSQGTKYSGWSRQGVGFPSTVRLH